jgi:hypothetical protein
VQILVRVHPTNDMASHRLLTVFHESSPADVPPTRTQLST